MSEFFAALILCGGTTNFHTRHNNSSQSSKTDQIGQRHVGPSEGGGFRQSRMLLAGRANSRSSGEGGGNDKCEPGIFVSHAMNLVEFAIQTHIGIPYRVKTYRDREGHRARLGNRHKRLPGRYAQERRRMDHSLLIGVAASEEPGQQAGGKNCCFAQRRLGRASCSLKSGKTGHVAGQVRLSCADCAESER